MSIPCPNKMREGRREMELIRIVADQLRRQREEQNQQNPIIPQELLREFREKCRTDLALCFLRYKTTINVQGGNGFLLYVGECEDPSFIQQNTQSAIVNTYTILQHFLENECVAVEARTATLRSGTDCLCYRLRLPEEESVRDTYTPDFDFPPDYGEPLEDYEDEQEDQENTNENIFA